MKSVKSGRFNFLLLFIVTESAKVNTASSVDLPALKPPVCIGKTMPILKILGKTPFRRHRLKHVPV